jgi:methylase of polypeptide subunit release factors
LIFRRVRKFWAQLTDQETEFPPPRLSDFADAALLRVALLTLDDRNDPRSLGFLLYGALLRVPRRDRPLFRLLAEHGLADRITASIYAPTTRIFRLRDRLIATDLLSRATPDQVFSLMFEQVYLVRNTGVRPEDRVLELCVGSGVNSVMMAERAASVTGVDLNPRALAFAKFNAGLNGVALELHRGSLFAPLGERRFDLVVVNPPFELVPEGATWFLHSDGGEDGFSVIRALLADLPDRLAEGGRFEMITWSPVSDRGPELLPLVAAALPEHEIIADRLGTESMDDVTAGFRDTPGYDAWRERLASRGFDRVEMLFLRASPGPAGIVVREPAEEIAACHAISDFWL